MTKVTHPSTSDASVVGFILLLSYDNMINSVLPLGLDRQKIARGIE